MIPWNFGKDCSGTSEEAIIKAGLNFEVEKVPLFVHEPTESGFESYQLPEYATYRKDIHKRLGIVGSVYRILQNTDAFKFMDKLIESHQIEYTKGGYIGHGEVIWMVAKMPLATFDVGSIKHEAYTVLQNGHNGHVSIECYPVDLNRGRIYSLNNGFKVRHSSRQEAQIEEGMKIIKNVHNNFERYGEQLMALSTKTITPEQFQSIVANISGTLLKIPADERQVTIADKQNYSMGKLTTTRKNHIETILELIRAFTKENNSCPEFNMTAYNAFNAVNEWANNGQNYRGDSLKRQQTRFANLLSGKIRKFQAMALDTIVKKFGE